MRVIADRYELRRLLGRGGMGEVWEAHDRTIARSVAVKLMPLDSRDRGGADVFVREARAAGGLRHPGVVTVHDVGSDEAEACLFLVMEHVAGRDLAGVLRADGPRSVAEVVEWGGQVADALAVAHAAGIVHRDLKPANLMLTAGGRIVVLDFGIARFVESSTRSSKVMGTLGYMAPERFDELPGDGRSDLYALGCILHELLTGRLPFEAPGPIAMMKAHLHQAVEPVRTHRPDVPAALDDLVMRLLAKDPDDRPATAQEVAQRLSTIARPADGRGREPAVTLAAALPGEHRTLRQHRDTAPTITAPVSPPGTAGETTRPPHALNRRRLLIAAAATVLVGGGATTAGVAYFSRGTKDPDSGATLKWQIQTGALDHPPAIADNVVYAGSDDGNLYAFDAATGATKWNFRTGDRVTTTPAVVEGVVYVASMDGSLYALDVATGKMKWNYDTGKMIYRCDPAVGYGAVHVSNTDGTLSSVDLATGKRRWSAQIGDATQGGTPRPAIDNGIVYILGTDNRLYAFDVVYGNRLWTSGSDFSTAPVVADGFLYIADRAGTLSVLNAGSGTNSWRATPPAVPGMDSTQRFTVSTPIVATGAVYLIADTPSAIALGTGTVKWQYTDTSDGYFGIPLVLAGNTLYACAKDKLHALDAATGARIWTHAIHDQKVSTVALLDAATVLVSGTEGGLYAVKAL